MLNDLIVMFARLPGLGPRSARRLVLHLIRHKEQLMTPLVTALQGASEAIRACGTCGNLDAQNPCFVCADPKRERAQICVVEDVADLWAIERSHMYRGLYHVLGGTLSAIDGRGPSQLSIDALVMRASDARVKEIILATNATVEGQTTAHYVTERLAHLSIELSQLAQGIPMGGELDYLDDGTLSTAFRARARV